ncbi:MAG: hypothetical protein Q9168_000942 [Polycauliona sp. 1 TL-2023]
MSEITYPEANAVRPTTAEDYYQLVKKAIRRGDLSDVESKLCRWRADTSIGSPSTDQINYLVPKAAEDDGQPEILGQLLSLGGKIGAYTVAQARSPAVFEVFMAHGWKVEDGLLRSKVCHPDLVALFLSKGANPDINRYGIFPLDVAALQGPLESVKLLLDAGARSIIGPNSAALHAAAQGKVPDRIAIMEYLVKQGADVNGIAVDITAPSEGRQAGRMGPPLHTAFKWANEKAKAWLLEHGADSQAKNQLGETPYEWGRRFDDDGPSRGLRRRRAQLQRDAARREREEQHEGRGGED